MAYFGKYKAPADVVLDDSLSHDEKIEMLEQWRDDKNALIRASEEGMEGDDRSDILKQVKKALIALKEGSSDS